MDEIRKEKLGVTNKHRMRAKLIFNPGSGVAGESPVQLMDVIGEMQAWKLVPETYLIEPDCDFPAMIHDALKEGIRMFVVCGGDGTINLMARALVGTKAILGIIPTGTRNNIALSLGIPVDIPSAIALLRMGRRTKVDVGLAVYHKMTTPFLEVCSVGLASTLFPMMDDIQHGNLTRVGDFLSALLSFPPAEMHLILNGKEEIHVICHAALISNMPYIGPHFHVGTPDAMEDGLLDVLLFADLSKIDLMGYAVQVVRTGIGPEDERILHYHVHTVEIDTHPATLVMVDGVALGEGPVHISVKRHALAVMAGEPIAAGLADKAVILETLTNTPGQENEIV